ncbi:MFS transporter [Streptomyces sioyaensis]|uniref:MFS transporter n=1 Tax=Streptomyces sioyaensis TaxID=67364 RepID=A0A4Q1QQW7_9ACTN|nr:MFS transporter [Streptomyces sioyaensis]MBM4796581.1 MFS transporter [Streptomyces sioyaensis]RXS64405.1 MFS transporter [Streptomyces sioyaensis]
MTVPRRRGPTAPRGTVEADSSDFSARCDGPVFRRDRLTALGYTSLAAYAYCLYALAPFLTLLRRDLDFSYLVMSLHSTTFAAGSVLSGLFFTQALRRLGRHRLFWLSAIGTAAGVVLLAVGHTVVFTLAATALLGLTGPMLQTSSLALLSVHHSAHRDRALVEANATASLAAVLAPAVIGSLGGTGSGWRAGLVLPVVALVLLYALGRGRPLPDQEGPAAGTVRPGRLPGRFWLRSAALGAAAGIEFGTVFYGAPLLVSRLDLSISHAATLMTLFAVGILIGRTAGSRLVNDQGKAPRLLTGSLLLTAAGLGIFWSSHALVLSSAALLIAGAGVANLFPLSFSHAIAAAPDRSDLAAARNQLVVNSAIMAAPLALGALSDRVGVSSAFAVQAVLIVAALLLVTVDRPASSGGAGRNPLLADRG